MNLTDIKPTQTAQQFTNSMQSMFGVSVDLAKLDLDKSAKLLLSVNEQIQKQRLSEDRHKLHTTKSYLAKIFIKERLEKHINELEEAIKIKHKFVPKTDDDEPSAFDDGSADNEPIPGRQGLGKKKVTELKEKPSPAFMADYDSENKKHKKRKAKPIKVSGDIFKSHPDLGDVHPGDQKKANESKHASPDLTERHSYDGIKARQVDDKQSEWGFDPKGLTALRMLVGSAGMARAKRAMEMAKQGRAVPAVYMTSFIPLIDILDDIMRSGMANVQVLKNLDKRAKKALGIKEDIEDKEEISDRLRGLYESQEDQAELLLASKDVVDRVQKAVDDLSKLRNEDLPPLLDAMRDEVGSEISGAYANIAIPTLDQLVVANGTARETLSQASRILTGEEQVPQAMGAEEVPAEEVPAEEFETADVAAGEEEIGRAER